MTDTENPAPTPVAPEGPHSPYECSVEHRRQSLDGTHLFDESCRLCAPVAAEGPCPVHGDGCAPFCEGMRPDPAPAPLTALECGHVIDAEGRTVAQDSPDPLREARAALERILAFVTNDPPEGFTVAADHIAIWAREGLAVIEENR